MRKVQRRYYRTIFLGTAAMAVLVWAAVDQFGIPWEDMARMFGVVVAGIALIILLAAVSVAVWVAGRALLGRLRGRD